MKDAIHLPGYFSGNKHKEVFIHYYTTLTSTVRARIVFTQNLICLLRAGNKEVYNSQYRKRIDPSEILLLTSSNVLMSENIPVDGVFDSILLFFSDEFLSEFCLRHQIDLSNDSPEEGGLLTIGKDDFVRHFEHSIDLLRKDSLQYLAPVKAEELLLYLVSGEYSAPVKAFFRHTLCKNSHHRMREVVARYDNSHLSIEELAFLCNMSVSTFKRNFKTLYSTSPQKYFIGNKMRKAGLLLSQQRTVSEISETLGYESLSSFSTEFKKHFGVSPKQYQEKMNR